MEINFIEFLRTGKMGEVCLGEDRARLEYLFDSPENWGTEQTCEKASVWQYGTIEFHFDGDTLCTIYSDSFEKPDLGESVTLDSSGVYRGMPREELTKLLTIHRIDFGSSTWDLDKRYTVIKTSGAVKLNFLESEPDEYMFEVPGLCSFTVESS